MRDFRQKWAEEFPGAPLPEAFQLPDPNRRSPIITLAVILGTRIAGDP
jgi:hypothetical protein